MYSHVISVVSSVQYEVGNQGCLYLLEWNMEWNMEWTVNVHRTAKSCNWHTAQSRLSYTYYSLGSYLTVEVLWASFRWHISITASSSMYTCLAASEIVVGYI